MRVLIAEDDPTACIVLRKILKTLGHETIETHNGQEAWNVLSKPDAPRLVILDWMMPVMDGLEVLRRLRQIDNPPEYTYVIMQTAKVDDSEVQLGYEEGVDDYLTKPLDKTQLLHRLHVAKRIIDYEAKRAIFQRKLADYSQKMENLAEERAKQLIHSARMASLGTLSAGIAHEINNPATFISGNTQTLERAWKVVLECLTTHDISIQDNPQLSFIAAELPNMMKGIRNGVNRISSIVKGLTNYARQGGEQKERFNLGSAVDESLQLCHNALKYNVKIVNNLRDAPCNVIGNKRQVEQVLVNLFTNAADAMSKLEEGVLTINVENKGKMIFLKIEDTGHGIPEHALETLFDPFYTTKPEGKGTGLGLSISKGIIEEHGGELYASNHPDGGAIFTFSLPNADHEEHNTTLDKASTSS